MKIKNIFLWLVISLFLILPATSKKVDVAFASNNFAYTVDSNDEKLSLDYLDFYSIPTTLFSYTNNGGAVSGNELSKAFDRNFSTFFKSSIDNNVSYTDPITNEINTNFKNTIDVTFSKTVKLDRILYASETNTTRGYPTSLNLYYDNGSGFELIKNYSTTETTQFVIFEFGSTYEMSAFRFEYDVVSKKHKYCATAKEIIFLQPESEEYNLYQNIFTDYAQTKVNQSLNSIDKIENFENKLKDYVNFSTLSLKIERAKKIVSGELSFDENFEFSTNPQAKKIIERQGNLESYARNELKLSKFGTNRQVIGVSANAGDVINIYVSANPDDPLPKIRFSQHMGHWRSWLGGENQLKLGKNTFTVPSYYHSDYSEPVCLGGAIYVVNPYTETEQSENVKIYIEGGTLYPVLSKNISDDDYLSFLDDYCEYYLNDTENVVNITEIVTDHTIVSVNATKAKEIYANFSPSQTISNWNNFMDKLLNFGGVYQDSANPLFNEKNLNIKVNLRVVQPWPGGWMFAAGEHIGVLEGSQSTIIYASGIGWGVAHEIGHMLDINERTVAETSNNMWAKFNETAIEKNGIRGSYDATLKALTNDATYADDSFFVTNSNNFLIWWYLEAWQKGYWGNLENCYRGVYPKLVSFINQFDSSKQKLNSLTATEKQVFYSSIVTGIDLSYYFERWGFTINNSTADPVFKLSTASDGFKNLMNIAVESNFVDNSKKPKLWYQDEKFYFSENRTQIYNQNVNISIKMVAKTSNGYNVFLNKSSASNHLGYEIWEGNSPDNFKVIGFTKGDVFEDMTVYADGYIPSYKVVAIDLTFSASALSESKSAESFIDNVCKIGDNEYSSLLEAVNLATDGDTIELLKSFYSFNIIIDKNLTIKIADNISSQIKITKIETGDLFTISSGKKLTLLGAENNHLVLDGFMFSQKGAFVNVSGIIVVEYVDFKNIVSTQNGGAIVLQNGSKNSTITNCLFENITAVNGSAICCEFAGANLIVTNSKFAGNIASDGIVYNKGTLTFNNCQFLNNIANLSIIKNYDGGVLKIDNCKIASNNLQEENGYTFSIDGLTEIKNCEIGSNLINIKNYNAIYFKAGNGSRKLTLENVEFLNSAKCNFVIKIDGDNSNLTLNAVSTNQCICFNVLKGTLNVKNNCNFSVANFEIFNGANLILSGGLFESFDNCSFALKEFIIGMKVFSCDNFELSSDEILLISSRMKTVYYLPIETAVNVFVENNIVYANPTHIALILDFGTGSKIIAVPYNEEFSLNMDLFETKYITSYEDDLGNIYTPLDNLKILDNKTLAVALENKIKIEFKLGKNTQIFYYFPNDVVELPNDFKSYIKIFNWKGNNQKYKIGATFVATQDLTLTANYINLRILVLVLFAIFVLIGLMAIIIIKLKLKRNRPKKHKKK